MKKLALLLCLATTNALAIPATVLVSQILYRADGTPYSGTVSISWQQFDTGAGEHIPAGSKTVRLAVNGLLSVALVPNVGAVPSGTAYTAVYKLDLGQSRTVAWIVPASGPVTVTAIESTTLVGPSSIVALTQLGGGAATNGQCPVWNTSSGVWVPGVCGALTSVSGTANQISVATGTTTPVISIPANPVIPGIAGIGSASTLVSPPAGSLDIAGLARIKNDLDNNGTGAAFYFTNAANNPYMGYKSAAANFNFADSHQTWWRLNSTVGGVNGMEGLFVMPSGGGIGFPNSGDASGSLGVALALNASGVFEINTGTKGTFGSLKLANLTGTGLFNFGIGQTLMPVGTSNPATCTVGQVFFRSDSTAGQNWWFCTATNTWTQQLNSGTGGGNTLTSVTFSSTPTFTRSNPNQEWSITLTGNVTSSSLSGASAGDILVFNIIQDATGSRTFAWPTGFGEACTIASAASIGTKQTFYWDGSAAHALTTCVTTASTNDLMLTDAANALTSAGTIDASAASVTAGMKVPAASGAVPTADDVIAFNTAIHAHVWGCNGNTCVGAVAGLGTTASTTCTNQHISAVSAVAAPSCSGLTAAEMAGSAAPGTSVTLSGAAQIFICTSTCTITVPVPSLNVQYCVFNDDNVSTVITLSAIGSSARYENTAQTAYGTAGTGTFISGGAVGDSVCIVGRDSTHYRTVSSKGTWTAN